MIFPPISYIIAEKMKVVVQKTGAEYKVQSGGLSAATLDRAENAVTYRVYGCEQERKQAYEDNLTAYEKSAVKANIWGTAFPPIYKVIALAGSYIYIIFWKQECSGNRLEELGYCYFSYICIMLCKSFLRSPHMLQSCLMQYIRHRCHGRELNRL